METVFLVQACGNIDGLVLRDFCCGASMACAGTIGILARQVDEAQRRKVHGIPLIEHHGVKPLFCGRIKMLLQENERSDRDWRGVRFLSLNVGIFDWSPLLIHKKLDAKIKAQSDPVFIHNHYLRLDVVIAQIALTLFALILSVLKPGRSRPIPQPV